VPDAGIGCNQSPAADGDEGKPLGVRRSGFKVIEMFLADRTERFDGLDDVPVAAVVLVEKEYERS